jgi:hypothetical protein
MGTIMRPYCPGDRVPIGSDGGPLTPTAAGSVHRIQGTMNIGGVTFIGEGAGSDLLTFAVIRGVGYVYLRGLGRVTTTDGATHVLGTP